MLVFMATGPDCWNLHGNHLHVPALQVLAKQVVGRPAHIFWVAMEFPIALELMGRRSGMLLGKIGIARFKTHRHGRGGGGREGGGIEGGRRS
ncbi:hypothetical protein GQ53DRAFT_14748 [Thozetella sp. PMI_491]|nr:hypothetical protein GQ53DRAFT_14748 [Thozetella sp. PMI_491]